MASGGGGEKEGDCEKICKKKGDFIFFSTLKFSTFLFRNITYAVLDFCGYIAGTLVVN